MALLRVTTKRGLGIKNCLRKEDKRHRVGKLLRMERAVYPSDLTDAQWRLIEPFLPMPCQHGRPRKYTLRVFLDAIFYVLRTGCQWQALPHDLPKWQTAYHYL